MWLYNIIEKVFSIFVFCIYTITKRGLKSRVNSDIFRAQAQVQMKSHIAHVSIVNSDESS